MTKLQKAILSFLTTLGCCIFGTVTWMYQGPWQQPLGPALQLSTATPFQLPATWTPDPLATAIPTFAPVRPAQAALTPAPALDNVAGLCGAPPVMNILVVGSDSRADSYLYGLADVIRLVRVDFVNPKVSVLEFPRDLWVEIPDIADNLNGQDHERLNQAYLYGNPGFGYTDDPAEGPGLLARTLALNFGTDIDHYVAANMQTFVKMVDALGGIDVTLPKGVDGRTAEDQNKRLLFPAGTHRLNGTQALTLARIRIQGGFERADNQNRVLCALRDQLTRPSVIGKIPNLIKSFRGAVQTDLSPQQFGQLACLGTQLKPENILFAGFPQEHFKPKREYDPVFKGTVFVWDVDFNTLRDYVRQFHEGTWPQPSGGTETEAEEEIPFCP
ncbi:MAG TPA: LCP family protein [Anaerolineales bacterium]|nr:LCP family protein [Anaerolineales bacterium]